jgi:hypothetical protein
MKKRRAEGVVRTQNEYLGPGIIACRENNLVKKIWKSRPLSERTPGIVGLKCPGGSFIDT